MRIKLDENMPQAMAGPARRLVTSQTLESLDGGLAIVDEARIRLRRGRRKA